MMGYSEGNNILEFVRNEDMYKEWAATCIQVESSQSPSGSEERYLTLSQDLPVSERERSDP
jgi:hypothetical protein